MAIAHFDAWLFGRVLAAYRSAAEQVSSMGSLSVLRALVCLHAVSQRAGGRRSAGVTPAQIAKVTHGCGGALE